MYLALNGAVERRIRGGYFYRDKASVPKDEDEEDIWTSVEPSIGGGNDEVHLWIVEKVGSETCRRRSLGNRGEHTHTLQVVF